MKNTIKNIQDTLEEIGFKESDRANLSKTERALSVAAGSYFALKGIKNLFSHPLIAAGELALGYGLLNRGMTGYCAVTEELEKNELGPDPILIVKESTSIV